MIINQREENWPQPCSSAAHDTKQDEAGPKPLDTEFYHNENSFVLISPSEDA